MPYNFDLKFKEYYNKFETDLTSYIENLKEGITPSLKEAISYSMLNGGKRLRPILGLATADLLGLDYDNIKYYLIALELIQSYSLVHDDLPAMDDDDYRRGKLSTHKKFGEAMGILAGDAMLNLAVETCLKKSSFTINDANAMRIIFDFSGYKGMVYGQVLDLESEKSATKSEELLKEIYLNKTVKMFKAPLLAMSALANNKYYEELNNYGEALGLAFQIQDDVLDVEGSLETIGKTPNKDKDADKLTSVKIYGLEGAKELSKKLFEQAIESVKNIDNNEFLLEFAKKISKRKF